MDTVSASLTWTLGAHLEGLTLRGAANIDGTGNTLGNTLVGNNANNLLAGLGGADSIEGRNGDDTLEGGAGADTLRGGNGADLLLGGDGNDQYYIDELDTIIDSSGIDLVFAGFDYTLVADVENLTLTGTAGLSGTGNGDANRITGNVGANLLSGLDGADTLRGGGGADTLIGGAGADRLEGGGGADVLRYVSPGEGGDLVVGFNGLADLFEVSAAGFGGGLVAGMNLVAEARFTVNTTGLSNSGPGVGQFVYETDANILWWDGDGSGGAAAVVIASFLNVTNFTGADIIVAA
jgi:Ca2+-binding RTX toxin-like protein